MKKKSHPTTKALKVSKKLSKPRDPQSSVSPWMEDYLDLGIMRLKPVNEATIERIAQSLLEWSLRDDAIVFRDYIDSLNMPEETYYQWVKRFPNLKAAHTLAKGRIGSRREKGGLLRKFDAGIVTLGLAKYDNEWKEFFAWKASLKDQSNAGNVTINLPNISTTEE